jgi:hypothetical protein
MQLQNFVKDRNEIAAYSRVQTKKASGFLVKLFSLLQTSSIVTKMTPHNVTRISRN